MPSQVRDRAVRTERQSTQYDTRGMGTVMTAAGHRTSTWHRMQKTPHLLPRRSRSSIYCYAHSSNSALACCRSGVSNPSLNHPIHLSHELPPFGFWPERSLLGERSSTLVAKLRLQPICGVTVWTDHAVMPQSQETIARSLWEAHIYCEQCSQTVFLRLTAVPD